MKIINKKYPVNNQDVLLIGKHSLTNETVNVVGYRLKTENRFITSPKGWSVNFTHYQEL